MVNQRVGVCSQSENNTEYNHFNGGPLFTQNGDFQKSTVSICITIIIKRNLVRLFPFRNFWLQKVKILRKFKSKKIVEYNELKRQICLQNEWEMNPAYSKWICAFKADKLKALFSACDRVISISNIRELALKPHAK